MNDVAAEVVEAPQRRLSFAFAKRHGVLVKEMQDGVAQCACRANASPTALAEARRFLRVSMKLERVAEPIFDELLRACLLYTSRCV